MSASSDPTMLPGPSSQKDKNEATQHDDDLDKDIEEIDLQAEVPCSSNQATGGFGYDSGATYSAVMPNVISLRNLSCQERYDIYTNEVKIADCPPCQVMSRVHAYLEDRLAGKRWLAVWKGPYESAQMRTVDILVEVDEVFADQAHVTLVEPLVCSQPSIPADVVEAQLSELGYHLDIAELFPASVIDDDEHASMLDDDEEDDDDETDDEKNKTNLYERLKIEGQQRYIAQVVDNARFYFEHLRRDWDDEDEGDNLFDAYLRSRLRLYYDVIHGVLPMPLVARYNRTMAKYIVRRKELLDFQAMIQKDGEPSNSEAVECWKRYYEVLMLSGLLQIWETLQLRADGPCFPRVLRRTNGPRNDNSRVVHLVTKKLTPSMMKDFDDDTIIRQHATPLTALQQCYEGDQVIIYPGIYSGDGFHELTESITIKGKGDRNDIIIEANPCDDLFLNISCAYVTLENLTFCQIENTEGVLRIESGHANIESCSFRCDGSGITVCEGAQLTMKNCQISGVKGAGVELLQGSVATLEHNEIMCCAEDYPYESSSSHVKKGGVHMHVTDPPSVKLLGNKISTTSDYGVTMARRRKLSHFSPIPTNTNVKINHNKKEETQGDGVAQLTKENNSDKAVDDCLKSFINLELTDNVIEKIKL